MYNYATLDPLQVEFVEIARLQSCRMANPVYRGGWPVDRYFQPAGKFYASGMSARTIAARWGMGRSRNMRSFARAMGPLRYPHRQSHLPAGSGGYPSYPVRVVGNMLEIGLPKDKERTKAKTKKAEACMASTFC